MIRNVVLGRLPDAVSDDDAARVDAALAAIAALDLPRRRAMSVGRDLGLRAGGWSFAIVNDWDDAEAYRRYDEDAEHNLHRAVLADLCEQIARVQFEV